MANDLNVRLYDGSPRNHGCAAAVLMAITLAFTGCGSSDGETSNAAVATTASSAPVTTTTQATLSPKKTGTLAERLADLGFDTTVVPAPSSNPLGIKSGAGVRPDLLFVFELPSSDDANRLARKLRVTFTEPDAGKAVARGEYVIQVTGQDGVLTAEEISNFRAVVNAVGESLSTDEAKDQEDSQTRLVLNSDDLTRAAGIAGPMIERARAKGTKLIIELINDPDSIDVPELMKACPEMRDSQGAASVAFRLPTDEEIDAC